MPQIPSYAEKTVLADNDLFVIADSAAANATKKVKASTIWKTDLIQEKNLNAGVTIGSVLNVDVISESTNHAGTEFKRSGTTIIKISGDGSAKLFIGASEVGAANINLASGVAVSAPNDGDIWYDGADLFMRQGGTTKVFTLT